MGRNNADDSNDNPGYIKLPVVVFVGLFVSVITGVLSVAGVKEPANIDELKRLTEAVIRIESRLQAFGDIARAAQASAAEAQRSANDNRKFIYDRTQGMYTADQNTKDEKKQDQRDSLQERRINSLEREVDKH